MTPFARLDQITHLMTDGGLASEWVEKLRRKGMDLAICEEEAVPIK
jgi:hypothetical protein